MPDRGKFITFEGGEGCGKSTQLQLLSEVLNERGIKHVVTREPGGTKLAERIRPLVVEPCEDEEWDPMAETLLFMAARVQHVRKLIEPALSEGRWVLCDRFVDSTLVYQGVGRGLGVDYLQALHLTVLNDFMPDQTILLDLIPEEGVQRALARNEEETRFEHLDMEFHYRVHSAFLNLARDKRFTIIDASYPIDKVHEMVVEAIF